MKRPTLAILGTFPRFEVHEHGKCLAAFKYRHQAEAWAARYIHRPTVRLFWFVMGLLAALAALVLGLAIYAMPLDVLALAMFFILSGVTVAGGMIWSRRAESGKEDGR